MIVEKFLYSFISKLKRDVKKSLNFGTQTRDPWSTRLATIATTPRKTIWKRGWYCTAYYQIDKISGSFPVPFRFWLDEFLSLFHYSLDVVHSLEPSDTPSNSASQQAPNYALRL